MKKILPAPESLSASLGEINGEVNLQWDTVNNANGYVVEYSIESRKMNWRQIDFVSSSHCTVTGLKRNKVYCFRVAAVNSYDQGPWSRDIKKRVFN